MALSPKYQQYAYLARFGATRHTVEYLITALYGSSSYLTSKTALPLPPINGVTETIPAGDALSFVLDWASENNYLTSSELDYFQKNGLKSPTTSLSRLFTAIQKRVVEPEHLLTDRLIANVAALEEAKKLQAIAPTPKFDPIAVIKEYNRQKLSLSSLLAHQSQRLQVLVPGRLTADTKGQVSTLSLQNILADNFESVSYVYERATLEYQTVEDDAERAALIGERIHTHLGQLIKDQHLSQMAFVVESNNPRDFAQLSMAVGSVIEEYEQGGASLASLRDLRTQASQALPLVLENRAEVYSSLVESFRSNKLSIDESHKLAEKVIRGLSISAGEDLTAAELIQKVASTTELSQDQVGALLASLKDTPTLAALDYEFKSNALSHRELGFTLFDRQLQSQGINPTLVPYDLNAELKKFGIEGSKNGNKESRYQENSQAIQTKLNEARSRGDVSGIESLSRLATQNLYDLLATRSEKGLSSISRANHALVGWRSKIDAAEAAFFDKWYHFEENLPWNKASRWITKQIDVAGHWINKQTGLPIYGFFGFVADEIHKFKLIQTTNAFHWVSSWGPGRGRQIAKWVIRQYRQGGLTIGGAISSGFSSATSSAYKWALTRAAGSAIWKRAAAWGSQAFSTTLGKGIQWLGGRLVGLAISAATVVGTVFSVVGLAVTALDLVVKPVIGFFQRFFSDPIFATLSMGVGAAIGAVASIPALIGAGLAAIIAGLGGALAGLAALFTTALFWALGALAVVALLFMVGINMAPKVDPGDTEAIARALAGTNGSPHLSITKEVTGSFNGDKKIDNSNVDQTLSYTVTVTAADIDLTNITIEDVTTRVNKAGSGAVGATEKKTVAALKAGESTTLEYTLKLDSSYRDSYLSNSVNVTATSANGAENKSYSLGLVIGTPPSLPAGAFATRLASAINTCYGTTVTMSDGGACLAALNDPQISQVISILVGSASRFTYLQCVGFIQAVMSATGGGVPSAGNAADFLTNVPAGYTMFKGTPLPGDLFVMGYDQVSGTGHIGVVIGVAGNIVTVADANWNGKGMARTSGSIPLTNISGYLRRN